MSHVGSKYFDNFCSIFSDDFDFISVDRNSHYITLFENNPCESLIESFFNNDCLPICILNFLFLLFLFDYSSQQFLFESRCCEFRKELHFTPIQKLFPYIQEEVFHLEFFEMKTVRIHHDFEFSMLAFCELFDFVGKLFDIEIKNLKLVDDFFHIIKNL